jgi:hyaluronoglucosaminidase
MKKNIIAAIVAFATFGVFAETIPLRGVVEGYYGRPWGTEGRLSLLKFMGEHNMNIFIYGPKDDPYHHSKWREPYPEKEMKDFKKLLEVAKANKINFCWAIHLGSGFKKGSKEDYAALFKKLGWMYDAGFRSFAVFFDDFGAADAEFHAEVGNRILKEFVDKRKGCAPLIMCPNVYWGFGHPYQKTLGEKLDRRVHIMWTGRGICSDITADAVKKITEDFKRPPFIWWNWPVNDYCRSKILLGRTYGLDDVVCSGFVSNPMENCEASKIALYGIAKWCKDPKNFDSKKVWEESFEKLYKDKKVAKAMRIFAEHNSDQGPNGHGYRREESVSAAPLCEKARNEFNASGKLSNETLEELEDLFEEILKASEYLLAELPRGRYDLGWEIGGWLEAQKYQMLTAFKALDIYKKYNKGDDIKSHVSFLKEMMSHSEVLSEAHRAKFAAATFANDKQWIAKPATATRELKPLIDLILEGTLKSAYKRKTGRDFSAASGFKGFSNARAIPEPVVKLDGKYAGYVRIMEYAEIAPGESFGIQVPEKWQTDYFHAKLGDNAAVKAGVIELSKDGKIWSKLNTSNHGENMEKPLSVEDGWKFARYRNISKNKVRVKINQFKFDVRSVTSPIEELMDELLK